MWLLRFLLGEVFDGLRLLREIAWPAGAERIIRRQYLEDRGYGNVPEQSAGELTGVLLDNNVGGASGASATYRPHGPRDRLVLRAPLVMRRAQHAVALFVALSLALMVVPAIAAASVTNPFSAGTRQWARKTRAVIITKAVTLGAGELLIDDQGNAYAGDGSTLIKNLRRFLHVDELAVNPADHGIAFDWNGTTGTNDTAAWNTLLAARAAGDIIVCPPGKTSRITASISIQAAQTSGALFGYGGSIVLDSTAASGTHAIVNFAPNFTVHGITVNASSVANAVGIRVAASKQRYLAATLTAAVAGGLYLQGAITGIKITSGCVFNGPGYGVLADSASTLDGVTIDGNTFIGGATGDAIEINTPTNGSSNVIIRGNDISGYSNTGSSGIGVGCARVAGVIITNNVIRNCGLDGIHVEDDSIDITIEGNRVYSCGRSGVSLSIGAGYIRTDTATVTNGSATVADTSITAADQGKLVTGTGIPINTYVGTVTAGTSFLLSSSATSQVNVNATANGTSAIISRPAPRDFSIAKNKVRNCVTNAGSGGIALEGSVAIQAGSVENNTVRDCGRTGATCYGIDLGSGSTRLKVSGNGVRNTQGTAVDSPCGIRWNSLTNSKIIGNDSYDTQATRTQQYGIRSYGICSELEIIGNDCNGNAAGPIDESGLSAASFNYFKRENRPIALNGPVIAPVIAGAATDALAFGNAAGVNGGMVVDSTNNKLWVRVGGTWKSTPLT